MQNKLRKSPKKNLLKNLFAAIFVAAVTAV
jgi:hypothetical protein